jgi:hypothetical protein
MAAFDVIGAHEGRISEQGAETTPNDARGVEDVSAWATIGDRSLGVAVHRSPASVGQVVICSIRA